MRASPLLLLALLAGCVAAPEAAPTPDAEAGADALAWELLACEYIVGMAQADPAKLQARLPEGFEVGGGSILGVADAPFASLGTEAFVCASGSTLDGNVAAMEYGSLFFSVVPSEEHRIDGVETYFWKEEVLVPDEPRRALFEARGIPVRAGSATLGGSSASPLGHGGALGLDGFGELTLSLEAPEERAAPEGARRFAEISPAGGGLAIWQAEYAWDEGPFRSGRGTITWPAGSWAADAVGGTLTPGTFHAGTWSFRGNLTLPRGGAEA